MKKFHCITNFLQTVNSSTKIFAKYIPASSSEISIFSFTFDGFNTIRPFKSKISNLFISHSDSIFKISETGFGNSLIEMSSVVTTWLLAG